jgi:hypothetical protein
MSLRGVLGVIGVQLLDEAAVVCLVIRKAVNEG